MVKVHTLKLDVELVCDSRVEPSVRQYNPAPLWNLSHKAHTALTFLAAHTFCCRLQPRRLEYNQGAVGMFCKA